ncbi:MAG: cache domain-containing protein [Arcobacteraceae bacterium]|nr:cache domain-containing protein [Arcobacteraceae bacterium]
MKFMSVSTKINIAIVSVSIVFLILASFVLFDYSLKTEKEVYENIKEELVGSAVDKIDSKMKIGVTNAISIANDKRIKEGLKANIRGETIQSIQDISKAMKENTEFQNIKIHIHTKNNISFLRSWKPEQYGDDLSSFRSAVVSVNNTNKALSTFEAGREGLLLRAIVPVKDENNNHLGSLEFIQGINSVVKEFAKNKVDFLLLMNNDAKNSIDTFKEKEKFKQYIISQETVDKEFLKYAKELDIDRLFKEGYVLDTKYFYTFIEIKDFQNNKLGIAILAKPLNVVNQAIDGAEMLIIMALIGIVLMILAISFIIMVLFKKLVGVPLKRFETALNDFFLFLQSKKDYANDIDIKTNDEFGLMAESLKQNIEYSAKLHEELYDLNVNLEHKVSDKTHKISLLLNNAGQGFLTFKKNFKIDSEYSKECEKLLGENIASKDISQLLFSDEQKEEFFKSTLQNALHETMDIKRNSYLTLLPSIILLNKKAIKLEYKILEDETFMMILTNITTQKKLENKIKKEQEIFKMVVAVASESAVFYEVIKEYEKFIGNEIDTTHLDELYRTIHTFKGAFSQFYMEEVVKSLHVLENHISSLIKSKDINQEKINQIIKNHDFHTSFYETKKIIGNILGDEFLKLHNFVKIDLSNILDLQGKISDILNDKDVATPECQDILCKIQDLSKQSLYNLLKPYGSLVEQLAKRFEKEIDELIIDGDKELLVGNQLKPFIKSLIHVFRNSVDHGIEMPDVRVEKYKEEMGTIACEFKEIDNTLYLTIADDGAGLNKEKIKQKALLNGIDTSSFDDEQIFDLIFNDNFTTKESVSDISGRGIGMSAVKNELEKLNGVVKVVSQEDNGTTFSFVIPL